MKLQMHEDEAGQRLDVVLAARLAVSRSKIQARLAAGLIKLADGTIPKAGHLVAAGQSILVENPPAESSPATAQLDLPILFQNDDILVLDKPAGLLVHSGNGRQSEPTVADLVKDLLQDDDLNRPGIVHRLDRNTSGLLLVARHPAAKAYLQSLFRDHKITKTYRALLVGRIEPAAATINLPLGRGAADRTRRVVDPHGRQAVTRYQTTATYPGHSLVEAWPATGRTHQLRAHFAAVKHPIVGDSQYGQGQNRFRLHRQFLHAARLEFVGMHGEIFDFSSNLPSELQKVLDQLAGEVY